jgi:steroid delta-isomerase-like uncharacterized protein
MAQVSELLDRLVDLFNAGRYEEAEGDYARAWKEAFPDARGTIATKIVEGNKGAAEIVWRGTNRGSLMGHPATGKSVSVRAVVVIETEGGKITRSTHYIDVAGMMAQLGMGAPVTT